jgi:hypothetical protein
MNVESSIHSSPSSLLLPDSSQGLVTVIYAVSRTTSGVRVGYDSVRLPGDVRCGREERE